MGVKVAPVDSESRLQRLKLSSVGDKFNPFSKNQEAGGNFARQLPESIYSAMIVMHLNCSDPDGNWGGYGVWVVSYIPIVVVWLLAVSFQAIFAVQLLLAGLHAEGLEPTCDGTSFFLRCVGLSLWVSAIVADWWETYGMHLWLNNFPNAPKYQGLYLQECDDPTCAEACHISKCTIIQPATGLTKCARFSFYLLGLLPKQVISVVVLLGGAGALLRSSDDFNLILNSLAATFVNEIDDLAYRFLLPASVKLAAGSLPPIGAPYVRAGTGRVVATIMCYSYSTIATVVAVDVCLYLGLWCM